MATFHENLVQSFTNFKNKFLKANGKEFHFAYDSTTQKYGYTIDGTFYPFRKVQASKTVTAGTSATTVTPDSGNDGIASVTVNPTPSQTKSATPSTSAQTITPDSGKLLSSVSISAISTQEKTVTGSRSTQTVTPDSGKYLTSVTVNKYPDASGTYGTITSNGLKDMGADNNYRYVGVNVPNPALTIKTYVRTSSSGGIVSIAGAYPNTLVYIDGPSDWYVYPQRSENITNLDGSAASGYLPKVFIITSNYMNTYISGGTGPITMYYTGWQTS